MAVTKTTFGYDKNILIAPELAMTISIHLSGTGIIKAGTPITGNLEARETAFTATGVTAANVAGILLHDVDIANNPNGTIVTTGTIDLLKLDSSVITALTADIKTALPTIEFIKGAK